MPQGIMQSSITRLKKWIGAGNLTKSRAEQTDRGGSDILYRVSFSLAAVALLFLVAFRMNESISVSWFFLSIAIAFTLIPMLARKGYELTSKFFLLAYICISLLVLSAVFGKEMLIQVFYIPACGLSILLFGRDQARFRNLGIALAVICYLILDYIIFEKIYLPTGEGTVIKWSILGAAFVTTWMTFNKFSDTRDLAEQQKQELLEKTRQLNRELIKKKEQLEQKVRELKQAKKKVEAGSRAKTEFLSTMSHEFRTPMNAIIGMTNLLIKDHPREDQLEQLEILDLSAKTLLALINDVLDLSEIETGKVALEETQFDLASLVNSEVDNFRFTAGKKNLKILLDVDENIPAQLTGDPGRLSQILNNLVSNAVKFTPEGTVKISVTPLNRDDDRIRLLFAVTDTGTGIPEDKQDKIFDSFNREPIDTTRIFGGAGLGLTISKKLVEFMGGRIYLESEMGMGSTFYVELEYEIACSETGRVNMTEKGRSGSLEGCRVLLVEDNEINQKVMLRFLERWSIEVTVASNGREAVSMAKSEPFDLILMDLQMPEMDGYEATRQIRRLNDEQRRTTPVIALTAADLKEVKEDVFRSGMNDYLNKPFNPVELRKKLKHYIPEDTRRSS